VTRCIGAGHDEFCNWGVSDGSNGARPLRCSHSIRTKIFFADVFRLLQLIDIAERVSPQLVADWADT